MLPLCYVAPETLVTTRLKMKALASSKKLLSSFETGVIESLRTNSSHTSSQPGHGTDFSGGYDAAGKRSGYGVETFPDGRIAFAGFWKDDRREGSGTEFYPSGSVKVSFRIQNLAKI